MTVSFFGVWLLSTLAVIVFASVAAPRGRWLAAMAGGFVATTLVTAGGLPDPELIGLAAAAGALVCLTRPPLVWIGLVLGGAAAGASVGLLSALGVPAVLGATGVVGLGGLSVWLSRRRAAFAPEGLRDEAMVIMGVLGLAVAVLPGVLDGWQAAVNLNVPEVRPERPIPAWAFGVLGASLALGAAQSVWSRR